MHLPRPDSRKRATELRRLSRRAFTASLAAAALTQTAKADGPRPVNVVPNFHPASCGWLTTFAKERVYCANSYLDHLDRAMADSNYAFVLSEVNNLIAILNFRPGRFDDLRQRIRDGRAELVNAFFVESTINLSGGEALVRCGLEGLRWQQRLFGVRPRSAWTIDVCGTHDQMAQISAGLGLDAMVYTRKNPTGGSMHWAESPDGSRILALSPGHYSELGQVFQAAGPLDEKQTAEVNALLEAKAKITPDGAPILVLGGSGDYSLAPKRPENPTAFLDEWLTQSGDEPKWEIRFTTLASYLDAVMPGIREGKTQLPVHKGGTEYDYGSFWIQNPRVKSWFRKCEHALQSSEMLASLASLKSPFDYPTRWLYAAWLQLFLNMDRNTLWGAAGGMVFEDDKSWDARDRFQSVEAIAGQTAASAAKALLGAGPCIGLFNPLNWERNDPFVIERPHGVEGAVSEALDEGATLCRMALPPLSIGGWRPSPDAVATAGGGSLPQSSLPQTIATQHYAAQVDARTGALTSLKLAGSGREMLGGPANVLVLEKPKSQRGDPGDHMQPRPDRVRITSSNESPDETRVAFREGPLALTVTVESRFAGGGFSRRVTRFYKDYPRVDFETELRDIPDRTVVVAEFPLAADILEVRRGIPYGFSHGAWAQPNPDLHGWTKGIVPAVRWSHYALAGGGLALLDRGLTGRELNGRTPVIYLLNATEKYYGFTNSWLSGKGPHRLAYALVAHGGGFADARISHLAWEYNCPPLAFSAVGRAAAESFIKTSANVIVESVRREGSDLEIRLVECLGAAGTAEVDLALPHRHAFLADLSGTSAQPLAGGPYRFPIRPQQIVTIRFRLTSTVEEPSSLTRWDDLVPEAKRASLHHYSDDKGHPPRGPAASA